MRQLHLRRDAAPVLNGIARHLPGIRRGTARHDDDLVNRAQQRLINAQLIQRQLAVLIETPIERVTDRRGLIVDLLFHEGVVATFLSGGDVPFHAERFALGHCTVKVSDLITISSQRDNLAVVHLHRVAGEFDEARHVRAQEVLALAHADHQRGVPARRHNTVRVVRVDSQQGKRTL